MGYSSTRGNKPMEIASKSSHSYIINNPKVKDFLNNCHLPKDAENIDSYKNMIQPIDLSQENPINTFIAVDGGYSEVFVKKKFPSSTICFIQIGASIIKTSDLNTITNSKFIDPEDMKKLNEIERLELVIPTKNLSLNDETSLIDSVRLAIHQFFNQEPSNEDKFANTLKWFLFEEFENPKDYYNLASCPHCQNKNVKISKNSITINNTFLCQYCNKELFLVDVFRFHEVIDNELGASGILSYLTTLIEQFIIIHLINIFLKIKPSLLNEVLFIKDGPLAFFGQTANMHKPMRHLCNYLFNNHNLYIAGLEKSGAFVEHAHEIEKNLDSNNLLLIDNNYIYKYITPGKADDTQPYGGTSYYGYKFIYKADDNRMYVISIPVLDKNFVLSPSLIHLKNINTIIQNIIKLKCDMYDNALIPIAIVNKLVSLANHPSSVILEKFAKDNIK